MGALPRPETPGPWERLGAVAGYPCAVRQIGTRLIVAEVDNPENAAAFAATWDRIAREDRVRELCGAVLSHDIEQYELARHILRILDGEAA